MPPFTRLAIPGPLWAAVIAHAIAERPHECCGLLAGRILLDPADPDTAAEQPDTAAALAVAVAHFPVRNRLASPTEYETEPLDLLTAYRTIRERRLELLAVYHSHPNGEPLPSRKDLERNTYGQSVVHLIVGFVGPGPAPEPVLRGWWLTDTGYREAELVVTDGRP